jgi:hypothetical protein
MRVVLAIGLGIVMGIGAMFAVGFVAVVLGVESSAAGALEGLFLMGGLGLGVWLALRDKEHSGSKPTVSREEWGRRPGER